MIDSFDDFNDDTPEQPVETIQLPDIESLKRKFRSAIDASEHARELSALDRGYYDGSQTISEEWKETLRSHKLVSPNINIVKSIVDGHIGVVAQHRTDPEALPRTPAAQGASDIATKTLRHAADRARFDDVKSDATENYFVEGAMAVIVEAVAPPSGSRSQTNRINVTRIHPNEFFVDPHSREYDYSDALFLGIAKWRHISQIFEDYPDAEQFGEITPGDLMGGESRTMRDAPDVWIDRKHKRVMTVEMYYREAGQWKRIVFCHAGVLDFGDSGYVDDDGLSICPIVPMSCYINMDLDNTELTYARYGVVRAMIGPSDEYNAHRAAMLKSTLNRRVQQVDPNALPVDSKIVREEASRPDGVLPPGWQIVPSNDASDHNAVMQLARSEIDRMGPTPAVLGRTLSDSQSGRSRMVQQQAGLTELGPILGRIERWEENVYRHLWWSIRQYWRDEMYIRVSGQAKAPEFLRVNVPTVEMRMMPVAGPDGQPQIDPMTGQPQMQEQAVVTGVENDLAELDVEVSIQAVSENASLEHEVRDQIIQIAQVTPIGSPELWIGVEKGPR